MNGDDPVAPPDRRPRGTRRPGGVRLSRRRLRRALRRLASDRDGLLLLAGLTLLALNLAVLAGLWALPEPEPLPDRGPLHDVGPLP